MQKKTFVIPIVAVVALFTGYNIYQGQSAETVLSDLALTNAEALARGGDEPGTHNHGPTRNPFLGKNIVKMRIRQTALTKYMAYHKY